MLQNTPVQRLEGGNPTTGLTSTRPVTHPRELKITCKPQHKDSRKANLMRNYGKKTVKRKCKKQNIIKYATWNVRGTVHNEELDGALNEKKKLKIAAITESIKKWKGTKKHMIIN
jgi:hypothetical protein